MDRRTFLERAAGGAVGIASLGHATTAAGADAVAAAPMEPTVARIGLQLYTVGDQTAADITKAIENVAAVGYKVLEFAGYGNVPHAQIRATLDRLKVTAPSTHISLAALRSDLNAQIGIAEVLGHQYITVPSPGSDMPLTADGWKKFADEFNAIGAKLRARKIGFAFHSHRDEFMDVGGGKTGMDVFIAGTDPGLVSFELDLGWARVAGQNPVVWFRRYPGRFKMWHVKDILALRAREEQQVETFRTLAARQNQPPAPAPAPATPAPAPAAGGAGGGRGGATPAVTSGPVPVGAGEIDFRPIFAEWKVSGLEYFFVEQDAAANWPGGSLSAITTSHRNLVNIIGSRVS